MIPPFPFEPDVTRATTLPPRFYCEPSVFELERDRVFGRTWQLVTHAGQLDGDGRYVCAEVAGRPLVIVRDGSALRAFHNVCRHRAGPVAEGCGKRKTLQCRYHGWTYALSGSLIRAPEMEGTNDFDPKTIALAPVRVEQFGPLVFVNLDPLAPPLSEVLGDIPEASKPLGIEAMRFVQRRDYVVKCNWKVYVDNYLEGYHLPVVHPGLFRELDYDAYRVELARFHSRQHAPFRAVAKGDTGRNYVAEGSESEAHYYWVFPNTMFNVYLGQLQTNVIVPLSEGETLTIFEWYAADAPPEPTRDPKWQRILSFSDEIQAEDIQICEAVQKNLRSPACVPGRYSAKRENGVHHFHGLLHEFLF